MAGKSSEKGFSFLFRDWDKVEFMIVNLKANNGGKNKVYLE